jgi:hypothetical protein
MTSPDTLRDTPSSLDTSKQTVPETFSKGGFFEEEDINQKYESFFSGEMILGAFKSSDIKEQLQQFLNAPENTHLKAGLKRSLKRQNNSQTFNKVLKDFIEQHKI